MEGEGDQVASQVEEPQSPLEIPYLEQPSLEENQEVPEQKDEKPMGWSDLHSAYEDGKLKKILSDLRTLSRPTGRFTDAEMALALEKVGQGEDLDPHDERMLDLLGRLYIKEDKIASAAERVGSISATQKAAEKRQKEVENGAEDPLNFQFDEGDLEIERKFAVAKREIDKKYTDMTTQVDTPYVRREHEMEVVRYGESLEYAIEASKGIIEKSEARLAALQSVDDGDFKTSQEIRKEEERLKAEKGLLESWTFALKSPLDRKTYWYKRVASGRVNALLDASKFRKPLKPWEKSDYALRLHTLKDSSDPADVDLENRIARTHTPYISDLNAYFEAPILSIMLRTKLEKAIATKDPRLEVYTQIDGQRVTGKVERLIGACEQAFQAGNSITLNKSMDLLTPEEQKQVLEYLRRRRERLSPQLEKAA